MNLSPPRVVTFILSTIMVAAAVLNMYVPSVPMIPFVDGNELWLILGGYLLLWLGSLLPGI